MNTNLKINNKSKITNKSIEKNTMTILDTNVCSQLFKKMQHDNFNEKSLKKLLNNLNPKQKSEKLYITELIKMEFKFLPNNDKKIIEKFQNIFSNKILSNNSEYMPEINKICVEVTNNVKTIPWAKNKMDDRDIRNRIEYDDAKKRLNKSTPKRKYIKRSLEFYRAKKDHDKKKKRFELGKQNFDTLLIESSDRVILSTALAHIKIGNDVSLITEDTGILCLSDELKKFSLSILGMYPDSYTKMINDEKLNNREIIYDKQLASNMTNDDAYDLEDELLD